MKLDKQIVSYITSDEHNDLCHMVNMEGRSISYILRKALLEYMSKRTPPPEGDPVDDSVPDSKPDNEHTDNNSFNLGDIKY